MKKILFRVDASNRSGAGHLIRSVALAQYLHERGVYVLFLTTPWEEQLISYLKQQPFEVKFLSISQDECGSEEDLRLLLQELKEDFDWVVLDNYYFGPDFQRAIRNTGSHLLVVDDRENHFIEADILVNHVLEPRCAEIYQTRVKKRLFGLNYIYLRREILRFPKRQKQKVRNILVTLGGSSQMESLSKVMRAISRLMEDFDFQVKILTGFLDLHEQIRPHISDAKHRIEVLKPVLEISDLYDWADIAVCAGGGTCLELCFFGIPGIVGILIDHQTIVAEALNQAGAFKSIGWYKNSTEDAIAQALRSLLQNPDQVKMMRKKAVQLVDGKGAERIFEAMQQVLMQKVGK